MNLNIILGQRGQQIEIPDDMLSESGEFFARMDRDMDGGWQMSMTWVEHPDRIQRCQIAANRLASAMAAGNETLAQLMAAYIVTRVPEVRAVRIETGGEMDNTEIITQADVRNGTRQLSEDEARARAAAEVSRVYKSGRGYRFAVLDGSNGRWQEGPVSPDEEEAKAQRQRALQDKISTLMQAVVWSPGN